MFTEGTDEVVGEEVALIDIAADGADPAFFLGRGCGLRFRFDVGLVIGVSCAGVLIQHVAVEDIGEEEGMGAEVQGGNHLAGEPGEIGRASCRERV